MSSKESDELNAEANDLISQTTSIIKSININNSDSQLDRLSTLVPKLDEVILRYKPFFPESIQICDDDQFMNIANKCIKSFLRNRRVTILTMYQKTFDHYHRKLDELTNQFVKASVTVDTIKESSSTGNDFQMSELKEKLESEYNKVKENNAKELEALTQKINQKINGMGDKVGDEDQRLTQHYEKILRSKHESLKMTETAYEKAKNEVDETTLLAKNEIDSITSKNNEILKEHNKSVMSSLVDEEKKVTELQEKVEFVTEELKKISPEFDRKWQERENELLTKFKAEDDQFALKKEEKENLLKSAEKEIKEYDEAINNIQNESQNTIEKSRTEFEKKIQELINQRQGQIDQEVNLRKEKYKAKIKQLKESLQKVHQQSRTDEDQMKGRIQDKTNSHQERLKKIKDDQLLFITDIKKEINNLKESSEKVRIQWDEEKQEIDDDFNSNINEIIEKRENSKKYFELKFEALRKELHHILQDNAKIFNRIACDNDDLLSLKLKHKEEEQEFSSRIQEKMKTDSELRIKVKIDELKALHSAEREKLRLEIDSARMSESGLQSQYDSALKESESQPDTLFTSFTQKEQVEEMNDSELKKWKFEVFNEIKSLKNEEVVALEHLCQTKNEFKEAIDKALLLREKLTETSKFYSDEVEKAKDKNEEQLNELRQTIVAKQKELNELEFLFDENEKELNRKARLVEKAEDKLNDLRKKLSFEKDLIKQKIIDNYQPLISHEHEKSQLMVKELMELTQELQISVDFKRHELQLVEASNQSMVEAVQKETSEKVKLLKTKLDDELKRVEADFIEDLIKEEEELTKRINKKMASFEAEENRIKDELQEKLVDQLNYHKTEIDALNNQCMKLMAKNSEKRSKINQISNAECQNCFMFQKSIKKIEKQLIAMQEEERDLTLTDKNHNETYQTFHNGLRKTLPPLRKY